MLLQDGDRAVNDNLYKDRKSSYRLSKTVAMLIRGRACFDFDLYRSKSADLAALPGNDALWDHFVKDGQFEGRVFRYASLPPSASVHDISHRHELMRACICMVPGACVSIQYLVAALCAPCCRERTTQRR